MFRYQYAGRIMEKGSFVQMKDMQMFDIFTEDSLFLKF